MPLYVYTCSDGHDTEAIRSADTVAVGCQCGHQAQRQSVYRMAQIGAVRPPVAERTVNLRQYREASEQIAYEHSRAEESAQRELPPPPLWKMAKKRAAKLMAAGVKDSLDYRPEYVKDD